MCDAFDAAYKQHVTRIAYISDRAAQHAKAMLGDGGRGSFGGYGGGSFSGGDRDGSFLASSSSASTVAAQGAGRGRRASSSADADPVSDHGAAAAADDAAAAHGDGMSSVAGMPGADAAEIDHSAHKLMRALCKTLHTRLGAFWKLAEDIASGRFARKKQSAQAAALAQQAQAQVLQSIENSSSELRMHM